MSKSASPARRPGLTITITAPTAGATVPSGVVTVTGHFAPPGPVALSVWLEDAGGNVIAPANIAVVPGAMRSNFTATFNNVPKNTAWTATARVTNNVPETAETTVAFATGN